MNDIGSIGAVTHQRGRSTPTNGDRREHRRASATYVAVGSSWVSWVLFIYPCCTIGSTAGDEIGPQMHRRGGLELLCDSVKVHNVNVDPADGEKNLTMKRLLSWVRTNLIKERPEMFMKGDTVRPGVLVLVNDCDWELSGQLDTTLEEKDVVVFISTLHGG